MGAVRQQPPEPPVGSFSCLAAGRGRSPPVTLEPVTQLRLARVPAHGQLHAHPHPPSRCGGFSGEPAAWPARSAVRATPEALATRTRGCGAAPAPTAAIESGKHAGRGQGVGSGASSARTVVAPVLRQPLEMDEAEGRRAAAAAWSEQPRGGVAQGAPEAAVSPAAPQGGVLRCRASSRAEPRTTAPASCDRRPDHPAGPPSPSSSPRAPRQGATHLGSRRSRRTRESCGSRVAASRAQCGRCGPRSAAPRDLRAGRASPAFRRDTPRPGPAGDRASRRPS